MQRVVDSLKSVIGLNAVISADYLRACMGENRSIMEKCKKNHARLMQKTLPILRWMWPIWPCVWASAEFRFARGMLAATHATQCGKSTNELHYIPKVKEIISDQKIKQNFTKSKLSVFKNVQEIYLKTARNTFCYANARFPFIENQHIPTYRWPLHGSVYLLTVLPPHVWVMHLNKESCHLLSQSMTPCSERRPFTAAKCLLFGPDSDW